jgi:hypothetical protein
MNEHTTEKIECPACGQRYTVEITDEVQDISCQACSALFTVSRSPAPVVPAKPVAAPGINRKPFAPPFGQPKKPKNSTGFLDRFIGFLFRFGKSFAGLLALVCLLAVFSSMLVFVWNLRTSFEVPTYADITATESHQPGKSKETEPDDMNIIEQKFGDRVGGIVKDYKLSQDEYNGILLMIQSLHKANRAPFVDGLQKALEAHAKVTPGTSTSTTSFQSITDRYVNAFVRAENAYESKSQEAKTTRWYALGSAFVSCFMLFMMLIIPALLKIEENTRKIA